MAGNAPKPGDLRQPLAGPHVCSRVGGTVSAMLKNALVSTCKKRGGSLNEDEIVQVIDLVIDSSEIFSIFQNAYSNCVGLSQSVRFQDVDRRTVYRFVAGALCRDTIPAVFANQVSAAGDIWQRAFITGFADFLAGDLNPKLVTDVYNAYRRLSVSARKQMTPLDILNDEGVVAVMADALRRFRAAGEADREIFSDMENQINETLSRALKLKGPSPMKINDRLASNFLDAISQPAPANPFRSQVLKTAKAA